MMMTSATAEVIASSTRSSRTVSLRRSLKESLLISMPARTRWRSTCWSLPTKIRSRDSLGWPASCSRSCFEVMARILITGSSEGLGLMAGQLLSTAGHAVTLHARNADRARAATAALPDAEAVLIGDVSTIAGQRDVAAQANAI